MNLVFKHLWMPARGDGGKDADADWGEAFSETD
jgi:hypothetical protein